MHGTAALPACSARIAAGCAKCTRTSLGRVRTRVPAAPQVRPAQLATNRGPMNRRGCRKASSLIAACKIQNARPAGLGLLRVGLLAGCADKAFKAVVKPRKPNKLPWLGA